MAADEHADEQTSDQARPIPPRYWWLKRILIAAGVLILALAALRSWWGWEAERRLEAKIAEYRAAGQPVTVEDFQFPPVPDEENAVILLEKAVGALVVPADMPADINDLYGDLNAVVVWSDAVGRLVDANAGTLRLVREARSKPRTDWHMRFKSPVIANLLPNLSSQRQLGKLLNVVSLYQHHIGDDAAAVETLGDALSQAQRLEKMRGVLISHLVGIAVDALVIDVIEQIAPTLRVGVSGEGGGEEGIPARPEQVRALIGELLDESALRESWRSAMYGERLSMLDSAELVTRNPGSLFALSGGPGGIAVSPRGKLVAPMNKLDALSTMDYFTALMDAGLAGSYPAGRARVPDELDFGRGIERHTHLLSSILLPSFGRSLVLHFRAIATRRIAATALAIRLYELDHGRRARTLNELVPQYLPVLPTDPFAPDGRPLGYLPNAPCPILYSVNLDGVDDGGIYALRESGTVDWDAKDLPFFLNGDRPRQADPRLATQPAATQAVEDQGDKVDGGRQTDESQTADDQP